MDLTNVKSIKLYEKGAEKTITAIGYNNSAIFCDSSIIDEVESLDEDDSGYIYDLTFVLMSTKVYVKKNFVANIKFNIKNIDYTGITTNEREMIYKNLIPVLYIAGTKLICYHDIMYATNNYSKKFRYQIRSVAMYPTGTYNMNFCIVNTDTNKRTAILSQEVIIR